MFAYCGNNPVCGYDPAGYFNLGWQEQALLGTNLLLLGVALLLVPPTGGTSLGAYAISTTALYTIGAGVAITGTAILGEVIDYASGKPTSRNQMQKQVESGQAPKEVDRVDGPHIGTVDDQNHIHFKDGTAINMDGTQSHKGNGIPKITNSILKWIIKNGWGEPRF